MTRSSKIVKQITDTDFFLEYPPYPIPNVVLPGPDPIPYLAVAPAPLPAPVPIVAAPILPPPVMSPAPVLPTVYHYDTVTSSFRFLSDLLLFLIFFITSILFLSILTVSTLQPASYRST